jgi:hypothetical protein
MLQRLRLRQFFVLALPAHGGDISQVRQLECSFARHYGCNDIGRQERQLQCLAHHFGINVSVACQFLDGRKAIIRKVRQPGVCPNNRLQQLLVGEASCSSSVRRSVSSMIPSISGADTRVTEPALCSRPREIFEAHGGLDRWRQDQERANRTHRNLDLPTSPHHISSYVRQNPGNAHWDCGTRRVNEDTRRERWIQKVD